MTIKKLSKKERLMEQFIGSGGKTTKESKQENEDDTMRFTLRIPRAMIEEIDQDRKEQIGNISRNTWILQVLSEHLKKTLTEN